MTKGHVKYGMTTRVSFVVSMSNHEHTFRLPFDTLRANGKKDNGYLESNDLRPKSPHMLRSIGEAFDTRMGF